MAASAVPDSLFRKGREADPEPKLALFLGDDDDDGTRSAQPYYHTYILRTPQSVLRSIRQAQATASASAVGSGQAYSSSYTNNVATVGGGNQGGIVIG